MADEAITCLLRGRRLIVAAEPMQRVDSPGKAKGTEQWMVLGARQLLGYGRETVERLQVCQQQRQVVGELGTAGIAPPE